jgi:putative FmdB family regulatory protein
MPTYEYACTSCGEHLEVVQSFRDDPLSECPACRGRLRKVFGSIGVVFKGSGFYKTDSRPAAKAGEGPKGGTEAASSAGSEGAAKEGSGTDKAGGASSGASSKETPAKSPSGEAGARAAPSPASAKATAAAS